MSVNLIKKILIKTTSCLAISAMILTSAPSAWPLAPEVKLDRNNQSAAEFSAKFGAIGEILEALPRGLSDEVRGEIEAAVFEGKNPKEIEEGIRKIEGLSPTQKDQAVAIAGKYIGVASALPDADAGGAMRDAAARQGPYIISSPVELPDAVKREVDGILQTLLTDPLVQYRGLGNVGVRVGLFLRKFREYEPLGRRAAIQKAMGFFDTPLTAEEWDLAQVILGEDGPRDPLEQDRIVNYITGVQYSKPRAMTSAEAPGGPAGGLALSPRSMLPDPIRSEVDLVIVTLRTNQGVSGRTVSASIDRVAAYVGFFREHGPQSAMSRTAELFGAELNADEYDLAQVVIGEDEPNSRIVQDAILAYAREGAASGGEAIGGAMADSRTKRKSGASANADHVLSVLFTEPSLRRLGFTIEEYSVIDTDTDAGIIEDGLRRLQAAGLLTVQTDTRVGSTVTTYKLTPRGFNTLREIAFSEYYRDSAVPEFASLQQGAQPERIPVYEGREFPVVPWLVPAGVDGASIDEARLCRISELPDSNRIVVVDTKEEMTYAADTVYRHLMGKAEDNYSLHLATGGTTEGVRKSLGMEDWEYAYSGLGDRQRINKDRIDWFTYWDDYRLPRPLLTAYKAVYRHCSYWYEHIKTIVGTLGFGPGRLVGPIIDHPDDDEHDAYTIGRDFHDKVDARIGIGRGRSRLLIAQGGIGTATDHWGFVDDESVAQEPGLLRRDGKKQIPFCIRAQNSWDFKAEDEPEVDRRFPVSDEQI